MNSYSFSDDAIQDCRRELEKFFSNYEGSG